MDDYEEALAHWESMEELDEGVSFELVMLLLQDLHDRGFELDAQQHKRVTEAVEVL